MNIFKLLTYDVAEHNCIWKTHQDKSWPTFWTSLRRRYVRLFRKITLKRLFHYWKHPFYELSEPLKPLTFITISGNNDRAMDPMTKGLPVDSYSVIDQRDQNKHIPTSLVLFYSLLYIWPLLKCYFIADKHKKSIIAEYFDDFFDTIGFMVVIEKLLRHSDVKLIVMANDHVSFNRAFLRVAQELGVKTMYVQHCSVTTEFPPLEFTYSFLDGEESLLKYIAHEHPKGNVYLSGNARFDIMSRYKNVKGKSKLTIGIAINQLDDENVIKQLCMTLQSRSCKNIILRPHPCQEFKSTWYSEHGISCSDSKVENPFEYLSHVDILISGDSGIHLDAAMMGVRSICYSTSGEKPLDWYSYIKNGLITYAANMEELLALLSNKNADRQKSQQAKLRWYNAAYGTKHEGHIGEMLADFIRFEQNGDIAKFDEKYGFVEREIKGYNVKIYKE